MNNIHKLTEDDSDDTLLFERWQQNVLRNCPNPGRIGCPSRETLAAFVDQPSRISLEELNDTHVFYCAECTHQLMELQRERERRLAEKPSRAAHHTWIPVSMAACLVLVVLLIVWGSSRPASGHRDLDGVTEPATLDLSGDGILRGQTETENTPLMTLPRKRLEVQLLLPYYSPAGKYRVTVGRERNLNQVAASGEGVGVASGAKTELRVLLILEELSKGEYYLGVTGEKQHVSNFYRLQIE